MIARIVADRARADEADARRAPRASQRPEDERISFALSGMRSAADVPREMRASRRAGAHVGGDSSQLCDHRADTSLIRPRAVRGTGVAPSPPAVRNVSRAATRGHRLVSRSRVRRSP
jgi:hypothetical protein